VSFVAAGAPAAGVAGVVADAAAGDGVDVIGVLLATDPDPTFGIPGRRSSRGPL
jgi:hypothetical protein